MLHRVVLGPFTPELALIEQIIDRRNTSAVMGLGEHLEELRRRVFLAIIGLLPIFIVAMVYGKGLLELILRPAISALRLEGQGGRLQMTGAMEAFSAYFYIALIATLVVGGPWVIYQAWKFISPGLYSNERRFAYVLAPLSVTLTIAGVCLMYFVMLPLALGFLYGFANSIAPEEIKRAEPPVGLVFPTAPVLVVDPIKPTPGQYWVNTTLLEMRLCVAAEEGKEPQILSVALSKDGLIGVHPKLDQYVDFFMTLALVFAITFQLPVIVLLLGWVGIVTTKSLRKWRKYAFAGSVILGAMISPTGDPISLAVLQVPMYLLYELGIVLLWLFPASRIAGTKPEATGTGDDDPNPTDATGP